MKQLLIALFIVIVADVAAFSDGWQFNRTTVPIDDSQSAISQSKAILRSPTNPWRWNSITRLRRMQNHDKNLLLISIGENTLNDQSKITVRFDREKAYTRQWIVNAQRDCLVWPNAELFHKHGFEKQETGSSG